MGSKRNRAPSGHPDSLPVLLHLVACEVNFELLAALAEGPANVSELARRLGRESSHVSEHLGVLRAAALVESTRVKREQVCRLTSGVSVAREGEWLCLHLSTPSGEGISIRKRVPVVAGAHVTVPASLNGHLEAPRGS